MMVEFGLRARRCAWAMLLAVSLGLASGCPTVLPTDQAGGQGQDATDGNATDGDADNGSGQPVPDPTPLNLVIEGGGKVSEEHTGSIVKLTATPDTDFIFDGWSGTTQSHQNPLTLVVRADTRLIAHFVTFAEDEDFDGVPNADDECPDTPFDEPADGATGCSCSQRDSDEDGVDDCMDDCEATPRDEAVGAKGCSCSQIDDDQDGVGNCDDLCPFTVFGDAEVDEEGCSPRERDTDSDGIRDSVDDCPDTAAGSVVNSQGCPPICGNNVVERSEDCDPPDGVDCSSECKTIPAVCGNEIVQRGEDCEPPGTDTCDANCRTIRQPVCGNNIVERGEECDPPRPERCDANCRTIAVAVCGNGSVEVGEECEPPNTATCDFNCRNIGDAVCGDGTVEEDEECEPPNTATCDANCRLTGTCGTGSCFLAHASPGCDDLECCEILCDCVPECCEDQWSEFCAQGATFVCGPVPSACLSGTGSCRDTHGGRGCDEQECCEAVCVADPTCCSVAWDAACVEIANALRSQSGFCICTE